MQEYYTAVAGVYRLAYSIVLHWDDNYPDFQKLKGSIVLKVVRWMEPRVIFKYRCWKRMNGNTNFATTRVCGVPSGVVCGHLLTPLDIIEKDEKNK